MNGFRNSKAMKGDIAPLSAEAAESLFTAILDSALPDDEVAAHLTGLARRGESEEEILGCVQAMLRRVDPIDCDRSRVIDIGGTGGDGLGTFNISTTAAFVVAGAGVPVFKHGNRGFSSRSGSADLVQALGIALPDHPAPGYLEECLAEAGIAYLFTPVHHRFPPGLNALRKKLGIRTIFNLAGPIAHPARLSRHMIGVSDARFIPIFARVLSRLGREKAWIFRGEDGADEISRAGLTRVCEVDRGGQREFTVSPEDFGLPAGPVSDIRGGSAIDNAVIARRILLGEVGPKTDVVLLCAASALVFAGAVATLREGVMLARQSIMGGGASRALHRLREISHDWTSASRARTSRIAGLREETPCRSP